MKNKIVRLKQGYDINISDNATNEIIDIGIPKTVAVKPIDFEGLKLKLSVETGSDVKAGDELGFDKTNNNIKLTSPVSGKILNINRGHRRVITEIVIETNEKSKKIKFDIPGNLTKENILNVLLKSGLFLLLKQRPFNIVADPTITPRDIFVSALNSAPMAPDLELILKGNEEFFQKALSLVSKLTSGKLYLSTSPEKKSLFNIYNDVELHLFEGKHPVGNVGVQIHHINPILNHEDVVWTIGVQGLILIGKLFTKTEIDPEILLKVTGSAAKEKKYFKTVLGCNISNFVKTEENARIISGDVLTGRQISAEGFVGYFDNLVSVIPEAEGHEFIGWIAPGLKKLSVSRSFLSTLNPMKKPFDLTTKKHGSTRAFVVSSEYQKVLPMDILPTYLMKSIIIKDIEDMEKLGIYEVAEEDVALCEYICPSKIEWQTILRSGLNMIQKEG